MNGSHEVAIAGGHENVIGSGEALTIEAWVRWESSDLTEVAQATGIDIDRMTLFCGSRAWGFQRGSNGADEWTFFLQTDNFVHHDTGPIPLPLNE